MPSTPEELETLCNEIKSEFDEKLSGHKNISAELKMEVFERIYSKYSNSKAVSTNSQITFTFDELKEKLLGNQSVIYWDKNWSFKNSSSNFAHQYGQYLLYKAGESHLVEPEKFILSDDVVSDNDFTYVNIKIKLLNDRNSEGTSWFWINGKNYLSNFSLIKFYFSFTQDPSNSERILDFFKYLTDELNVRGIPFQLKFEKEFTERYENAVLYTQSSHYFVAFHVVKKYYDTYRDIFRQNNLLFTKKILPEIAFAEEPSIRGMSFGRLRSLEILNAITQYYTTPKSSSIFYFVKNQLEKKGYSIEELYRNPQTHFNYDFSIFSTNYNYNLNSNNNSKNQERALFIGRILCRQATIFVENGKTTCHWISVLKDDPDENPETVEYHKVNDSFLQGRLGIIYFLAHLYKRFPDDWILKEICEIVLGSIKVELSDNDKVDEIKSIINIDYQTILTHQKAHFKGSHTPKEEALFSLSSALRFSPLRIDDSSINNIGDKIDDIIDGLEKRGVYSYKFDDAFIATLEHLGYVLTGFILLLTPDRN